jgi:hypothetical protein
MDRDSCRLGYVSAGNEPEARKEAKRHEQRSSFSVAIMRRLLR